MSKYKLPKVEELFDAGAHFGHQVKRWHPKMEPYIYSVQKNIHIINLEETAKELDKACAFLYEKARSGEQIVLVGTKRQAKEIIQVEAQRCGAKFVSERWLGGTITNFRVIKKNTDKLVDMLKKRADGEYQKYTKKERLLIDREIEKLQLSVGGIVGLDSVPGALVVVDSKREKTAIKEAILSGVKIVGIVDTNSNPSSLDYPIPANDDAIKSLALIIKTLADAIEEGYKDHDKLKTEKREAQKPAPEVPVNEEPELKIVKVTSDDENLVIEDDLLAPVEGLEAISDKEAVDTDVNTEVVAKPEAEKNKKDPEKSKKVLSKKE